jgi:drug/metabolite transporter (DMT)-like permease
VNGASSPPEGPSPPVAAALMALVAAIWGSTWFVIKIGLGDLPVLTGAGVRFLLAGVVMALISPALSRREGGGRPAARLVVYQAAFQFVFNYGLVYYAESELPSGLVAVLWAVYPLLMALTEHFVLKTVRLGARQWLGFVGAFAGVVLLFSTDVAATSARALPAALLVLLAPAGVVVSTTAIKRHGANASSLLLNRDSMLLGGLILGLGAFVFERPLAVTWTPAALFSVAYLALLGTVLTFGVYLWLLRFVPAYRLSLIAYVTPVLALMVGAFAGGEPLGQSTLFGTALVLGGVASASRKSRA